MKSGSPLRLVLWIALPCAGFALAWTLARHATPPPAAPAPPLPTVEPHVADRRPLTPERRAAAPAPPAAVRGDEWVELNNDATNDLTAGELAAAVEKLERCLAARPDDAIFAGNLTEALVRLARSEHERGALDDSVTHLERALEVGGDAREDIAVLRRILERWREERELARDDWTDDSDRFELAFDTDRNDILHHSHEVLEHLERTYDKLVGWFGADPLAGAPKTRVVLYEPADFDRLTGLGDWAAGLFDGVVRVSVRDLARGQEWKSVLVHELVHAFVQARAGNRVPGWLNEGLAQLLEQVLQARPSESMRMAKLLEGTEPFPLEQLEGSLTGWTDTAAIGRAYAESLLFVESLRATYGDDVLRRMVSELGDGSTPAAVFERATSVPLRVAFEDWCALLAR